MRSSAHNFDVEAGGLLTGMSCIAALLASPKAAVILVIKV
jgi:hypothetical protein